MNKLKQFLGLYFLMFLLTSFTSLFADERYDAIYSGTPWFDQNNNEVNAHGACIVKEGDLYYLFGEHKTDTINAFSGFSCYSSPDLMNWKFENMVLKMQPDGLMGPNRVGERVKVMKCPATGEFVMYMHSDNMQYKDPHVAYATCKTIDGNYQFHGDLMYDGKYIKRWDMGTFQDNDGKGYLLTHEGFIYELSSDYKSAKRIVASDIAHGGESPAMFKKNGVYFWMFSNKTSWERNDNYYFTATSLEGPWEKKGLFTPQGSLTWNSQCSFVLPITTNKDTLYIYMGDRWSFPKQGSAATYVWQPITVKADEMSIPDYYVSWKVNPFDGKPTFVAPSMNPIRNKYIIQKGSWIEDEKKLISKEKGAVVSYSFEGTRITIGAISNDMSGYANVILKNSRNEEIINTIIDFYSLYEYSSLKFISPELKKDSYTLSIEVLGVHPAWSDKQRSDYGSKDDYVVIESVYVQ